MLSGKYTDFLSGILPGTCSDILSDMCADGPQPQARSQLAWAFHCDLCHRWPLARLLESGWWCCSTLPAASPRRDIPALRHLESFPKSAAVVLGTAFNFRCALTHRSASSWLSGSLIETFSATMHTLSPVRSKPRAKRSEIEPLSSTTMTQHFFKENDFTRSMQRSSTAGSSKTCQVEPHDKHGNEQVSWSRYSETHLVRFLRK